MPSDFYRGVLDSLTVPDTRPPSFWAQDNVYIEHSERRAGMFDRSYAPWLNEPLDQAAKPGTKASLVCASVQSGKTQLIEIHAAWALANAPGPAILTAQTDRDAEGIVQDKILKTLRASPGTEAILARLREDDMSRSKLLLPGMPWDIQGPGKNKIQSKTRRYLYCDELWRYEQGVVAQLLKRSDAALAPLFLGVSQAGSQLEETSAGVPVWDDWGEVWHKGTQSLFCIACPTCRHRFGIETAHIEWTKDETTRDQETKAWNWRALKKTVRLKCPGCGTTHSPGNTLEARQSFVRKLSEGAVYLPTNPNAAEGWYSYRLPVWNVWWKDWGDMVEEYLRAKERWKAGIEDDYRLWVQQREARFWVASQHEQPIEIRKPTSTYKLADYAGGGRAEGILHRFMACDVQRDHYWAVIRDFYDGGASRLIWEGRKDSWGELDQLSAQYRLNAQDVVVDASNWREEVYRECDKRGWVALHGKDEGQWRVPNKNGKGYTMAPYSGPLKGRATQVRNPLGVGRPGKAKGWCWMRYWSNLFFKDWLARLRAGTGLAFELPADVSEEYLRHQEGERRETIKGKPHWVKIGGRDDHLRDCELMILVRAMVKGGIFDAAQTPEPAGEIDAEP